MKHSEISSMLVSAEIVLSEPLTAWIDSSSPKQGRDAGEKGSRLIRAS